MNAAFPSEPTDTKARTSQKWLKSTPLSREKTWKDPFLKRIRPFFLRKVYKTFSLGRTSTTFSHFRKGTLQYNIYFLRERVIQNSWNEQSCKSFSMLNGGLRESTKRTKSFYQLPRIKTEENLKLKWTWSDWTFVYAVETKRIVELRLFYSKAPSKN